VSHIEYSGGRSRFRFDKKTSALAVAKSLRDRLIECWNDTMQQWTAHDAKRVYIFSPQFSLGKRIKAVLVNLCLEDAYRDALAELGIKLEEIYDYEVEEASTKKG
jgi:glycogen phosphorylase